LVHVRVKSVGASRAFADKEKRIQKNQSDQKLHCDPLKTMRYRELDREQRQKGWPPRIAV